MDISRTEDRISEEATIPLEELSNAEEGAKLLWITPTGSVRELATIDEATSDGETWHSVHNSDTGERSYPQCRHPVLAETIVREHLKCGHVTVNAFLHSNGSFRCPKCKTDVEEIEQFPSVGTVTTCLICGEFFDSYSTARRSI